MVEGGIFVSLVRRWTSPCIILKYSPMRHVPVGTWFAKAVTVTVTGIQTIWHCLHINLLELMAVFFGLKCFANNKQNSNILLRINNTTAIVYITRMRNSHSEGFSSLTREIWLWCEQRDIWIAAAYIRSCDNVEADRESRKMQPKTEIQAFRRRFPKNRRSFWRRFICLKGEMRSICIMEKRFQFDSHRCVHTKVKEDDFFTRFPLLGYSEGFAKNRTRGPEWHSCRPILGSHGFRYFYHWSMLNLPFSYWILT